MALKHVGRIKSNQRKVIVAYRTVPNEPENCIVVTTENLEAADHDSLMKAVESTTGQQAYEFAEAMARTQLSDGRNMLAGLHTTGKMIKISTSQVEMTPDRVTVIPLNELNEVIAEQKGISVEDLAIKDPTGTDKKSEIVKESPKNDVVLEEVDLDKQALQAPTDQLLTDDDLAAKYRSDADRLFKEAKKLREMAEELVPTKKTSANKASV